jgi:rare lipoprotein A
MYRKKLLAAIAALSVSGFAPAAFADQSDVGQGIQEGFASYYSQTRIHVRTATGERFNQEAMTAAHESLPLGSWARVTNLDNGRVINVRINDRKAPSSNRVIDLSRGAAKVIGMLRAGLANVRVEPIPAPRRAAHTQQQR